MATDQQTNAAEVPGFHALKGYERRAVILRYEGKTYNQIANNVNDEFATTYAERTVGDWFMAGGRLEQAYHELMDAMAAQSLKEARQTIKLASRLAAGALVDQLRSANEPQIRQGAAKALLNKYIPDKQVVLDGPGLEEDLPAELVEAGSKIAAELGEQNAPDAVDNPPEGQGDSRSPGPSSS